MPTSRGPASLTFGRGRGSAKFGPGRAIFTVSAGLGIWINLVDPDVAARSEDEVVLSNLTPVWQP